MFGNIPRELTLGEVIERILCNDPKTRLAWANAKAQAAQTGIAQSAYLPRLNGGIGVSHGSTVSNYEQRPELSNKGIQQQRTNRLSMSWVLFDFGRRDAALSSARQLLVAANANQDATLQNSFAGAAQLYYNAISAQRSLNVSTQIEVLAAKNLEAANAKYKAGTTALSDRLQAQTAYSQANLGRVRNAGALRTATGVIALRMGLPPDTSIKLSENLTPLPDTNFVKTVNELLAQAREDHPALIAAQARIKAAEANLQERRAAGRPTLSFTADISESQYNRSIALSGDRNDRDRTVGLQLSIPLFEGFERAYQIRNAQARLEASRVELIDTEQMVLIDLWTNYQTLSNETLSLKRTEDLVAQSRESLEVIQGRYQSGVGSMIELLNALTSYAAAEEQHIAVLSNWQLSRLRLASNLGRLGFWALP
ncbi:TolC family protein [Pseudomonas putida]|uniref:TolC family protein n=1 Tax=Pseudomonas putida TaxID=303 RepID=UPI003D2EA136